MYGIFPYIWLIFVVNVGKYKSLMDPMGVPLALEIIDTKTQIQKPGPIRGKWLVFPRDPGSPKLRSW